MSDRVVVMNEGLVVQIDAPVDMYEVPRDAFVSDFVGKTNLLEGAVTGTGGAEAVEIAGVRIKAPVNGHAAGTAVLLSLRPEKLVLSAAGSGEGMEGRINAAVFHGDQWLYQVSSALGDLIVTEPNMGRQGYDRGDDVLISWPEAAVRVLPREGGHG